MAKDSKEKKSQTSIYGPDEPIESLHVEDIVGWNPMQFGSMPPEDPFFAEFSLGPWHELRRQMMLFTVHVRPPNDEIVAPRRDPGAAIEQRCDMWIVMFLRAVVLEKKLIPPPKDLRKWLYARAQMALSLIEYEVRTKEKREAPDLKNQFKAEMGSRLVIFWQELGKKRWLENDPETTSIAE